MDRQGRQDATIGLMFVLGKRGLLPLENERPDIEVLHPLITLCTAFMVSPLASWPRAAVQKSHLILFVLTCLSHLLVLQTHFPNV